MAATSASKDAAQASSSTSSSSKPSLPPSSSSTSNKDVAKSASGKAKVSSDSKASATASVAKKAPRTTVAATGSDPATEGWQAIWDPSRSAYFFWHDASRTSTWENPYEASRRNSDADADKDGTQTKSAQGDKDHDDNDEADRPPLEIDPELAFLDPALALASRSSSPSRAAPSSAVAYTSKAHFDPRTGRFLSSAPSHSGGTTAALAEKHGAYADPAAYFSAAQRAQRQMDVFFDAAGWQAQREREEDQEARAAELVRKKRRIELGLGPEDEEEDEHHGAGSHAAGGSSAHNSDGSRRPPTKKELKAFQERKQARKKAKLDWLKT